MNTEAKINKIKNCDFEDKQEKLNIKKIYKIKNSNIKKLLEFQKKQDLK